MLSMLAKPLCMIHQYLNIIMLYIGAIYVLFWKAIANTAQAATLLCALYEITNK